MQKYKVVILHMTQLSLRWESYYCIPDLLQCFDVEYWDCSAISIPHFYAVPKLETRYVREIVSIAMYETELQKLPKDTIIVNDLLSNKGNSPLLRIQSKYFKTRVNIGFFANTQGSEKVVWDKIKNISLKRLQNKYYFIKWSKVFNTISMNSLEGCQYRINHPDYEMFLKLQNDTILTINYDYIVYLDNFFPFHPEISMREFNFSANEIADDFYSSLNKFFIKIEKIYSCKVVIAAHPKSVYQKNPFEGRKIVYNETARLIKNCQSVCMHTSNALSYVMLYDKPVALIHNKAYRYAKLEYKRLQNYAKANMLPIMDIDFYNEGCNIFQRINNKYRETYIQKYLQGTRENISNVELFKRYFKDIHDKYLV